MNHDLIKQLQSLSPTEGEGGYISLRTSEDHEKLMKLAIPMRQEILAMAKEIKECKEVISELLHTYVINLNDNGHPNASITDILKLMDRATKLTPQPK